MFSFLYLIGPGIISWLICRYFSSKKADGHLFQAICEILAYSAVVMILTTVLLEGSGDVSVEVLASGMLTVQYDTAALALSAALAAGIGVLNAAGAGKIKEYRRKFLVAGVAAAAALCIFVYGTGAPTPDESLQVSTKPVRINNVYYNSDVPIYVNDSQEYFIQARKLSEWLGIIYEEKRVGLFQTEYSLGTDKFRLNLFQTEEGYFKKNGELFISFSVLENMEGIQVKNSPTLTDGSVRQVLYIDNYMQSFHYDWTQYTYVAHALGGIEGNAYTNSLEAFTENYRAGQRVFEADLRLTGDGELVVVHDLPENKNGEPMTQEEFEEYKIQGKYTSLTFKDLAELMKEHPDMYLVTDTKETEKSQVIKQFTYIAEAGNQTDPEILQRIIPQIYNMEMLDTVMSVYNWNSMIYALYELEDFSESEVIDFAYQRGIGVITVEADKAQNLFFQELYDRDIKVYMHTYNTPEEETEMRQKGVWGLYTDFLLP